MSGKSLLIIDDEKDLVDLLALDFEEVGLEVTTTTDPREGLKFAQTGCFDYILCDNHMPHVSGIEILQQLENPSNFYLFSGNDDVYETVEKLGGAGVVPKPVKFEVIVDQLLKVH